MPDKFRLENVTEAEGGLRGERRLVVAGEIDREHTDPVVNIFIEATELYNCNEEHCYKSITNCMLLVQDINDNKPTFNFDEYFANVNENVYIGEPMIFVAADGVTFPRVEDLDVVYNSFNISFQDESMKDYFSINPDSMIKAGQVRISSSVSNNTLLDADSQPSTLELVLVATDNDPNNPEFYNTATFTINIIDVNDIAPKFEKAEYTVTVKEDLSNLSGSKELVQVTAEDGDKSPDFGNASLRYDFVTGLPGLRVDSISGVITVENNPFDFELQPEHLLEVRVRDCGEGGDCVALYDTATIKITVENVNDNPPKLNPEVCERTFDNTVSQDKILDISATDGDNDTVTFSMDDSLDIPFSIDNLGNSKGVILVDTKALVELEKIFTFNVTLTDNGNPPQSVNVPCTMNIRDVNDKDPVFTMPESSKKKYWIRDDLQPNQAMTLYNGANLVLKSVDNDTNPCYNTANYFFHNLVNPDYEEVFSLEATTGILSLKNYNLSHTEWETDEGIKNLITLSVEARDGYGASCNADDQTHRRAQADLLLKVFTNFEPYFSKDGSMEQESHDFNETVMDPDQNAKPLWPRHTFQAAVDDNNVDPPDSQDWEDQAICYYILDPPESPFQLDKLTNTLRVTETLDVDHCVDCNTYYITIGATNDCQNQPDNSTFEISSRLLATINVRDLNDNAPEFTNLRSYYVYSTIEGECKDCDISAQDDDIGSHHTPLPTLLSFHVMMSAENHVNVEMLSNISSSSDGQGSPLQYHIPEGERQLDRLSFRLHQHQQQVDQHLRQCGRHSRAGGAALLRSRDRSEGQWGPFY